MKLENWEILELKPKQPPSKGLPKTEKTDKAMVAV